MRVKYLAQEQGSNPDRTAHSGVERINHKATLPRSSGGQDLQMLNFAKGSSPTSPQYECSQVPEGCHSAKDCHRKLVAWCSCKCESCIAYTDIELDYSCNGKKTAVINIETDWEERGCEISYYHCYCTNPSKERTTVWKIDMQQVCFVPSHYVSLNLNISKGKDEF